MASNISCPKFSSRPDFLVLQYPASTNDSISSLEYVVFPLVDLIISTNESISCLYHRCFKYSCFPVEFGHTRHPALDIPFLYASLRNNPCMKICRNTSAEFHSRIVWQLICPLCFFPSFIASYSLRPRLSSARTPVNAIPVKSSFPRYFRRKTICGEVLCTLQHHLFVVAGGPKIFHVCVGRSRDDARKKEIPSFSHDASTFSTTSYVSVNSIRVFPNKTMNSSCGNARCTMSRATTLSFPPLNAT